MMQCPMCRSEKPNWENVDKFRIKPEGMAICNDCGFISYPDKYKTKQEIIDYYKKDYRNPPQVGNLYSGQRKLHYHSEMLKDVFKDWIEKEKKTPVVSDVGAAFGMLLGWIGDQFPEADLNGVELTQSFVRNAWHEYGLKLEDDFNDSKKYDLICSYKSLEHILDPDVELTRYIDSLSEDGILYLSVPIWFRKLCNFGTGGFDIEYYYHPNHINTWNLSQFEALIKVCGGEVIRADHVIYESSYLIKRNESFKTDDRESLKQNVGEIKTNLNKVFSANEAFNTGHYDDAIKIWPNFPIAHTARYENNRKIIHDKGFDWIENNIIKVALESCEDDPDMVYLAADIYMRYNKYEKAVEHLERCLKLRPKSPNFYMAMANSFRAMADNVEDEALKINLITSAREASRALKANSVQSFAESTNWIYFDNSKIPTPFEG